jgi:DNA-binding CsgD family transcriptional regulator
MAVLSSLLERAPDQGGAVVLRGEAGAGKTALLRRAIASADGFTVVRSAGIESEMELAFAALHQLCLPLLDRLDRLPGPQRDALETAFGLSAGAVPDRFLVGLAALGLLSYTADVRPLLCVVDDAQWLDRESAQALAFVGRRAQAEPILLLFATREADPNFTGLPELPIEGLPASDARKLLALAVRGPLDPEVRERIIAETRGNPLALLELPRGLRPDQLAGGFGLLDASSLADRIEESFAARLELLPAQTRRLLLVAATESIGDAVLVRRACERLGVGADAVEPARREGLLDIADHVRFRHPLVRSAVYRSASAEDRRRVHATMAEVSDPGADPDRRAWHRAQATLGVDEEVAAELERSAGRAQRRGGWAAAAAFLERSVALTPNLSRRAQRALAAARAKHLAGAPDAALGLVAIAQSGPLDDVGRARVDLLRGQIAHSQNRVGDAPPLLLKAATRLQPLDPKLARETYLDALTTALLAGRLAPSGAALTIAKAALAAPPVDNPPRSSDLLLDGLATRVTAGFSASAPVLKRALVSYGSGDGSGEEELRWMWLAGHAAVDLWDHGAWEAIANRHFQLATETGALGLLPLGLSLRIAVCGFTGDLAEAAQLIDDVRATVEATGIDLPPYAPMLLDAWRGRERDTVAGVEAMAADARARGMGLGLTVTHWARAVLYNGLGRYDDALAAAEQAVENADDLGFCGWGLVELISAAARAGRGERAAAAFSRLSETTRASGGDWALGIEARSHALLCEGEPAERLHREAIERLGRTRLRADLARAKLGYGEWLRFEGRRLEAREQLRTSRAMFAEMGIEGFAARAEQELEATGERAHKGSVRPPAALTTQEADVAGLARDGLSNPEIGARLFISPRTVEYHLHKVFAKLGVSSRSQLRGVLPHDCDQIT